MRALVQRVSSASCAVEGKEVAAIGPGMLVLLGVGKLDADEQARRIAEKLMNLRIFAGEDGRTDEALGDREVLCVSQFTLYANTRKGNRPSFVDAADPAPAERLYDDVCDRLNAKRGVFGAQMSVESINDGPMTVMLEVD